MEPFDLDGREFVELCDLMKLTGIRFRGGAAAVCSKMLRATVSGRPFNHLTSPTSA